MTDLRSTPPAGSRRRLAIVSGLGNQPMTPRGQRTVHLIEALREDWSIELIASPAPAAPGPVSKDAQGRLDALRPLAGRVTRTFFYDPEEPGWIRRLARWRPDADAAVLVAAPWSAPIWASRRLRAAGVPYVVDTGDPWVLTSLISVPRSPARWRAEREETALWRGASGAIVTTRQQGRALASHFPDLEILVRPNGYEPAPGPAVAIGEKRGPSVLRLVHFGLIYRARLDIMPLLVRLRDSGRWRHISFTQYGDVFERMLDDVPEGVDVVRRPAVQWREVTARIHEFDAAVVLGNLTGNLLPSKAIQYLTLPVPRIAVTDTGRDDALTEFAAEREAWLAVSPDDPRAADAVAGLVDRDWSAAELAPPEADAWPVIGAQLADFIETRLLRG
jgi:hypothetical protein